MALTIAVVVCACNEARLLPPCLYSLRAQTRPADQILVVNNASTDDTRATAAAVPGITVLDEPTKGLVVAREAARRTVTADMIAEAANRDDLFSVTSRKHYPYIANSDFHKRKHLYSWKTLLRCEKDWTAIARTLRSNVDVAVTLYRNGSWISSVDRQPAFGDR